MTTSEFSNEFDIMYNNIMSNQAPGLNEYEKSVFLTEAQNAIVTELYSGRNNKGLSFESSEEARRLLQNLIVEKTYSIKDSSIKYTKINKPTNLLAIVYEDCILENNNKALVIPVKYDSLYDILNNPFKCPSKNRVLRVDGADIELYSNNKIKVYNMTYLSRPTPIILDDFYTENTGENGETIIITPEATIEGEYRKTECMLDPTLHFEILQRAVLLAKSSYIGS